jgi:hypothetical protein
LPARHHQHEPPRIGIADCPGGDAEQQIEISARKSAAAAVSQGVGDYEGGARQGGEPESGARPLVRDPGSGQRRRKRQNADHDAAMRGRHGLHRERREQRKADGGAQSHECERSPGAARRHAGAKREHQAKGRGPGNRRARKGDEPGIERLDREPRRGQRAAEQDDAEEGQQKTEVLSAHKHAGDAKPGARAGPAGNSIQPQRVSDGLEAPGAFPLGKSGPAGIPELRC